MNINELLEKFINDRLIDITISNAKIKDGVTKVKVRPILIQDNIEFQFTEYVGSKVFHTNSEKNIAMERIVNYMQNSFKQAQLTCDGQSAAILSGNKGNITVKVKENNSISGDKKADLSHNRSKQYILKEGEPVDFLIDLGVMAPDGKIIHKRYDKFKQINRFLEFIEDILPQLDRKRELTIIDFGCGKSYLTFAMYYYLKILKDYDIKVIGLDLKEDVIKKCSELKDKYGFNKLEFCVGDIASYDKTDVADMVVTLHACDTATDYALAKAVGWGAKVILSVPCCQREANSMIKSELLQPVLKYGILKERMAAILTDAVRTEMLESCGYKAQILEFIDMEHTPKNLLIRAVKVANSETSQKESEGYRKMKAMEENLNMDITINRLLEEQREIF